MTKTLATVRTYDPYEATETGYRIDVRDDGTARIVYRSCWQGSTTGTTWIARCPDDVLEAIKNDESESPGDDVPDTETAIRNWVDSWDDVPGRRIRVGHRN